MQQSSPKTANKWRVWARDAAFVIVVLFAFTTWQNRHLLSADDEVIIASQQLIDTQGELYVIAPSDKQKLLYFFAPWCTVCRFSIGNLSVVNTDKYEVIRIALDYQSLEEVQDFARRAGIQDERILMGAEQHKARFNIQGYPTYYVLDQNMRVLSADMGYSTAAGLTLRTVL